MTTTLLTAPAAPVASAPSTGRRAALVATTALASLAPTVWGISSVVMLATGHEADHRFHQVTGQGVLLSALWLLPLLLLARAGWSGRRPSVPVASSHVAVMVTGLLSGLAAPTAGGLPVGVYTVVTGLLVWAALPVRPRLQAGGLDVVLAPLALLMAALVTTFAVGEADLQRQMADEHAHMAHYFDMVWVTAILVGLAVFAAFSAACRRLAVLAGLGLVVVGASRWLFTDEVTWSALAVVLGALTALAGTRRSAS